MSFWSDWSERLKALFLRSPQERDLDDELRFHVDREIEERVRAGLDPATAKREALRAFGGMQRFKEEVRDARGVRPLDDVVTDTRYALRGLRRSPVFAAAAILVLALGLGASTAVFTIADRILFADLPYPGADRLVRIHEKNSETNVFNISTVDALAIREQQKTFEAVGFARGGQVAFSGAGRPEQIDGGWATAGFFRALTVDVAAGRMIEESDEAQAAPGVAVVSAGMARERFGGLTQAIGRAITIDGLPFEVVGVLRPGVEELAAIRTGLWLPLKLSTPTRRGPFWLRGYGRRRAGVTLEDAARDLASVSERIFPIWASSFRDQTAKLTPIPLQAAIVGRSTSQVELFAVAVLLVLLVAIANVATLMLVRASAREQELAVRSALGADRGRLARLLITDSVVLTVLAGAVGVGITAVALQLVVAMVPNLPRVHEVVLGGRSLGFAAVVATISGLLVGGPALLANLVGRRTASLRLDTRRVGVGRRSNATRSALVVVEFALALPLLVGAGLLLQSFVRLQRVDPGYQPRGAISVTLSLQAARYQDPAQAQRFWRLLEQRVTAIPGVTAAGLSLNLPPNEPIDENNFDLLDRPVPVGGSEHVSPWSAVSPGYFQALGVPLLEGRTFAEGDSNTAPPVIVVSRAWAKHYYPNESAVGRQMISGGCTTCPPTTVVGVVGDVKYQGLAGGSDGVYNSILQDDPRYLSLVVRSTTGAAATFKAVREVVASLDPELPVVETTLEERLTKSIADPRRWTTVLGAFAATAAMLAALGVFGLMSYSVRQRRREIGVRLALGAAPGSVTAMVVQRGVAYALAGTAIGVGLTLLESRWLASFLFGVGPTDPATVVGVAVLLLVTAGVACWLPGRQAAQIHPVEAIAAE